MSGARHWRFELAQSVASLCAKNPQVRGIVVGGSVARGTADMYSDIDTLAFCDALPTEGMVQEIVTLSGGEDWLCYFDSDTAICGNYKIGAAKVDLAHIHVDVMEKRLADVVDRYSTDADKQKSVGGLLDAMPLYGADFIKAWQAKAATYPEHLGTAMVKKYLNFRPLWVLRDYAVKRGSVLYQYESICEVTSNLLGVLLGLNRLYHPGEFKWLESLVDGMVIKPTDFLMRINQIFQVPFLDAVDILGKLIENIFSLVEQHMPDFDTTDARVAFHLPPETCEQVPERLT